MHEIRIRGTRWHAEKGLLGVALVLGLLLGIPAAQAAEAQPTVVAQASDLTLEAYIQRVWARNETLQIRAIETAIADERYRSEKGIFEPEFVAEFEAVDRRRPNTAEQKAALQSGLLTPVNVYNERNRTYSGALESLLPTGAKFHAGYTLQSLENNLNDKTFAGVGEWVTTVGISLTQPLLKGGGVGATMAGIRAAAINSDLSYQEYRRAVIELIAQAEAAYWDLYQAQEQTAISKESLRVAETLLTETRKRLELGKAAEIEVLQAESGVAQRQATLKETEQRLAQARSRTATYVSEAWTTNSVAVTAIESPVISDKPLVFIDLMISAYGLNPSYVTLVKQAELEGLRVKVAKNQRLPQLDLKAGYGFSGIGMGPQLSFEAAQTQDFPNWSVGLEMHIPLGGGAKSRHDMRAAELRRAATEQALNGLATTLENSIRAAITSVEAYRENAGRYEKMVKVNQDVLATQLARLEAGKVESRAVLEAEEDLFKGKIAALENMIRYLRSQLDLEATLGNLLQRRHLDLTQQELRDETGMLVRSSRITPKKFQEFADAMKKAYEKRRAAADANR